LDLDYKNVFSKIISLEKRLRKPFYNERIKNKFKNKGVQKYAFILTYYFSKSGPKLIFLFKKNNFNAKNTFQRRSK